MKDEYIRIQAAEDAMTQSVCGHTREVEKAMEAVRQLPAADVVPVIHSEWEYHMSFGICHNCGYEYDWKATDARNYCPNCGADMRGEQDG